MPSEMHYQDLRAMLRPTLLCTMFVDRPPNPLSIFNVGLDKRLGNLMSVSMAWVRAYTLGCPNARH